MKKSKLIAVLKSLTKDEWQMFRKHVLMCTFVKSEIYRLFVILHSKKNDFDNIGEMDAFRKKYFPQLSTKAMSNLMAKLYQIVESWLSVMEMKNSLFDEEIHLLKNLNKRGLYNQANSIVKKIETRIKKEPTLDLEKSKSMFEMYYSQYYSDNPNGKLQLNNLIKWHVNTYLETSCLFEIELINWGSIARIDFHNEIDLLNKTTQSIDPTKLSKLLHSIKSIFSNDDIDAFHNVVNALFTGQFPYGSDIHLIITNYMEVLSRKLFMKGLLKDPKHITKIQTYSLELSAFKGEGKISSARFQNIVGSLSYINTYEWTQKFIDKWIDKVTTLKKESNKELAYAQNCFYHNHFDKMLKYTYHTSYDDINQKIRALSLQLIGLYHLSDNNVRLFNASYKNLKALLNRNKGKLSISAFNSANNLVTVINYLFKDNIDKVQEALNSNQNILYRSWVENQLEKKECN